MRQLFTDQEDRAKSLLQYFSASTAELLSPISGETPSCWSCELSMNDAVWCATYLGPSVKEVWSFLVWRQVEILETIYREAVAQYTEPKHRKRGYAAVVLRSSLRNDMPLLSDREGLTFSAFRLWYSLARECGEILDTETGDLLNMDALPKPELWNAKAGCERYQIIFRKAYHAN